MRILKQRWDWRGTIGWVRDRANERSTWLGLIGLLTASGLALDPDQAERIIALGLSLGGLIAAFSKDR